MTGISSESKPAWKYCPECGCGPGDEHRISCSKNPYVANKYRAERTVQDPRFVNGNCLEDMPSELPLKALSWGSDIALDRASLREFDQEDLRADLWA
jgi:hypothetical protein